ncbi:3-oxoacyl-[acyl-carrier-protein] synthase-3 [Micromonospora sp. M71_S20]|uniref:ketoacyl-ACP synthase III family protein n=1 Tax=Micromonospora sp. M71_S20 TaxID=592872 RepID=UPI000F1AA986|nr:ketoacyl-ACP synthase III family protein [Micromonospora sp. M71_S20]RLK09794.1 3-oxoacyl-[acyl-carrier-protein] synthase-3 [Micromonospora sp. M71_S20]
MPGTIAVRTMASFLPERSVAVAELPELAYLGPAERELCAGLGIDRVRTDPELDAFDLAAGAATRALTAAGLAPARIGALVVVESRAPATLMSSAETRLQAYLGAERALTFSVGGLGCVSSTPALLVARGLLAADPDLTDVLVVHGSTPATPRRYRHPVTVSGDGGMAVVVSRDGPLRVRDVLQETDGRYWDLFRVDYRDRPSARWTEQCRDPREYSFQLALESRNRLRAMYRRLLDRNGLTPSDVARHVSHNLSAGAFRFVEETLGVAVASTCRDNLRDLGHLGANDVLLNLATEIGTGRLRGGERAVLVSSSPVAAWSMVLVEFDGDPAAVAGD